MKLTLLYFSPTHTTKKIVSAVGKVLFEKFLCHTEIVDLTPAAAREREYAFLIAHSMLHLMGYDHEAPEEARVMEERQAAILESLQIFR